MKIINKKDFLEKGTKALEEMLDVLAELPIVKLEDFPSNETALVIVDMVNGFAREGALMSPRVEALIPCIAELSKSCDNLGISKVVFADCHSSNSPEFDAYPKHCMEGTSEGEIVEEIKEIGGYILINKNSTNGFLELGFQEWLKKNHQISTFIITGDCTDICIQQFAITLKTWFNMQDKKARVVVPINMVETYDFDLHNGDLVNVMALYNMMINGVEVVSGLHSTK